MKARRHKTGVTLVEMLIVVAVIAVLVTMVIGIAARIDTKGKEQLTRSTFALLNAALGQFHDYGYRYPHLNYYDLKFPLDCNSISDADFKKALGATTLLTGEYLKSDVWYFFLSRVPTSRKTLDKIDESLKQGTNIIFNDEEYSLLRILDPWGTALRYRYDYDYTSPEDKGNFPVITSAGPDETFGTADDITSR